MTQTKKGQSLLDIPRVLRKLSIGLTLLIVVLPPLGYWTISYQQESDQLEQSAELISHAVSKLAYLYPNEWDLQTHRLEHLLEEFRPRKYGVNISIWDNAGHLLIPIESQPFSLPISREAFILSSNGTVGKVVLEKSLVHRAWTTIVLGLTCLVLASSFLIAINIFSIRGIERVTSEVKQAHLNLQKQQMYLDGILSSSASVAIIATDKNWNIQYYNDTAERLFGRPIHEILDTPLYKLHDEMWKHIERVQHDGQMAGEDIESSFIIREERDNQTQYIEARISTITAHQYGLSGYTLMCSDITEQHKTAELIQYQATYDSLTDLPNRRLFKEQLDKAIARGKRHNHLGAILFLDLDDFKNINDSLGHSVGDVLLQKVAQRMKSCLREEDTVARLGGDEFIVLLPEVSDNLDNTINNVQELAAKVGQTLSMPYEIMPHTLHVTLSIGITVFPNGEDQPDDVIRQADTAMYRAKEAGRNTFKFFLPSMQRAAEERLNILGDLRQGFDRSEYQTFFQPQFDAERTLIGAEALVRWQHPEKGLILPNDFISVAEESGLILELDSYVLRSALASLHTWLAAGIVSTSFRISVNISAQQFKQANFVHKMEHALGNAGVDPANLILELTEGILLENFESAVEKMLALKNIGVRFSIDDFGTGYSSLAYLKRLPVDEVKIDQSFVRDLLQNDSDAALVDTIVILASRLNLDTVAEGVETEEQYENLKQLGCRVHQGFLLGKPMSQKDFKSFIVSQSIFTV